MAEIKTQYRRKKTDISKWTESKATAGLVYLFGAMAAAKNWSLLGMLTRGINHPDVQGIAACTFLHSSMTGIYHRMKIWSFALSGWDNFYTVVIVISGHMTVDLLVGRPSLPWQGKHRCEDWVMTSVDLVFPL